MSQDAWPAAIKFVLAYEGGYVNDPVDPGGETNFGISKKAYPVLDIKALTVEDATAIYRRDYWDAIHGDELPGPLSIAVFDCAVNQGAGKARRLLQVALDVTVDGEIGPRTVAAAFAAGDAGLRRFLARRGEAYIQTILARTELQKYAYNWMNRLFKLAEAVRGVV